MKAFLVGLLFMMAVLVLSGIGLFLYPLLFVLGFFLRFIIIIALGVFAIWLLGKFIIYVWEALKEK